MIGAARDFKQMIIDEMSQRLEGVAHVLRGCGLPALENVVKTDDLKMHTAALASAYVMAKARIESKERIIESREKTIRELSSELRKHEEASERRMDIIGGNGNTGEHYEDDTLVGGGDIYALDPLTANQFLSKASGIMEERGKQYDKPDGERSMPAAFNAITGRDLRADEGWLLMVLLKHVRLFSKEGFHQDSAIDGISYSALMAEEKARI